MKQWILIGVLSVSSIPGFSQSGSLTLEEISNPDPHGYASFGSDVFIQNDQAIVLSKGYSEGQKSNGAFYVYSRDKASGAWQFSQKVVHQSVSKLSEWFGSSAALSGDYLLIGAHSARDAKNEAYPAGAAFMYERNSAGEWQISTKLSILPGEDANGQKFGTRVALNEKYAAVLAATTQEIYLFDNKGSGNWNFTQKISGKDYLRADGFKPDLGSSMSIDGEYLYIGASTDDSDQFGEQTLSRSGAIYIFKRDGSNWTLHQKLTQPNRQSQSYFGSNINVSGNVMVVSSQENHQGAVEIYQRDKDGVWSFSQKLVPNQRFKFDRFGAEIAMDANRIAVAAPNYDVAGVSYAGAVFLYAKDIESGHWMQEEIIAANNPVASERMGSVQLNENAVVIGVPTRSVGANRYAGTIFVSNLPSSNEEAVNEGNEPLRLYPNPVTGSFNLEFAGNESITDIHVFDSSGRQVDVKFKQGQEVVNTSNLSAGVYLIKVQMETGKVFTREFTVASY